MTEVDVRSSATPATWNGEGTGGLDEDGGATSGSAYGAAGPTTAVSAPVPAPAESGVVTSAEVAGDEVRGESDTGEASGDVEVSPDAETSVVTATEGQLSAEAGEESAVSDLRGIEGFVESTTLASEFSAQETGLAEAGAQELGETAEFLPILAALVPTLISSVGPVVAKGIQGALSPRARAVVRKLAPPVTAATAGRVRPGSQGALLAQIAQLLRMAQARGESGAESAAATPEAQAVIAEAAAVLETIIGTDDRVRITDTRKIPWRRICALRITFPTGAVYRGTGFFIGPRAVATAGHCVYLHGQGGWARKVEVIPGANDSDRPFGSAESVQLRSVGGWVNQRKPASDYGCVVVAPGAFNGQNLGSFGVGALTAQELVAKPAVLAGYPGDKPFAQLWGMARKIKTVAPATLGYDIDTVGGQSGAPVYINRNGNRTVVGIHNYGSGSGNSATRITAPVAQRLIAWSKL
ncbi:trypsin-like serine protease [Nakamurella flava]|uniref:Serine protease n=1 Tax=Nakamurella flava TaxID=2576308 RepID=A0A4U6QFL7_9ACTN|nr:trypsin-like serine protease [Nakamurella flava]TKV58816.1 trypsin-like serine protease [Nakamurella flava]